MAHDTVDRVAETANYAEKEVRGAASRAAEQAREMQEQALAAADENVKKARSYIEENPLMSAGIAFAAGVIFSALIGADRRLPSRDLTMQTADATHTSEAIDSAKSSCAPRRSVSATSSISRRPRPGSRR